jgi:hypothetical protein
MLTSRLKLIDRVAERGELEKLGVGGPDCAIFGLLDVLMFAEFGRIFKVCVVLEEVWYHEVDSSWQASRYAGRDAGRKISQASGDDAYGSQTDGVPAQRILTTTLIFHLKWR